MTKKEVVRSSCHACPWGCGILIHLEGGKPVKIEGDPKSPIGNGKVCIKAEAALELLHPDRLKHPLKRMGQRGEGKWKQITWDEALDEVAGELAKAKESYGAESVACITGAANVWPTSWIWRFAYAFGTPNYAMVSSVCELPRVLASVVTCGDNTFVDLTNTPKCIIIWGTNPAESKKPMDYYEILEASDKGAKLIVIDPRKIDLVSRADIWIQPRPGSDLLLALAMINVIINEGLYDKDFVDKWTFGFDELKAHVQDYPPEKMAELTWVDAEKIKEAARLYATSKPAGIQWGNAIDHTRNSFQSGRALSILKGICGNFDVAGGELPQVPNPVIDWNSIELCLKKKMTPDMMKKRVDGDLKILPIFGEILPQSVIKGMLEGAPYHIHAAYIQGCNPVISYSDTNRTVKALNKLDFLAVADMFMTPTAALADIVLPAASFLEFDSIGMQLFRGQLQIRRKVAQVGEARSDYEILSALAKRLDLPEAFPWDNYEQCLDYVLSPNGVTFSQFQEMEVIEPPSQWGVFEVKGAKGFNTPSGKVELYSNLLKLWGLDPLPIFYEIPETPFGDPELAKEYPLILTNAKVEPYRHTQGRSQPTLRNAHPEPVVSINDKTASKLGIKDGDWVYIENKRGRIRQKAILRSDIDPRVVFVDWGWWFPERGPSELYGYNESNINVLTVGTPHCTEIGSPNLKGLCCKVYKCE